MLFTHDTSVTLATAADLASTGADHGSGDEDLPDVAAVNDFLQRWGWSWRARTPADVEAVHALRVRVRALWSLPQPELVTEVNALLVEGHALPQIVEHGPDYGWHIHATRPGAPLAQVMMVDIAMALADLVRADETDRLKVCAGEDCDDPLVDLSRNRSRRYCEGGCANRAHVAAYRARKAAAG